jgi:hypothetical protein
MLSSRIVGVTGEFHGDVRVKLSLGIGIARCHSIGWGMLDWIVNCLREGDQNLSA